MKRPNYERFSRQSQKIRLVAASLALAKGLIALLLTLNLAFANTRSIQHGQFVVDTTSAGSVTVGESSSLTIDTRNQARDSSVLFGVVRNSAGSPIESVSIQVSQSGILLAQTVTDEIGAYRFSSLPEGLFAIDARKSGYRPVGLGTPLSPSQPAERNFILFPLPTRPNIQVAQDAPESTQNAIREPVTSANLLLFQSGRFVPNLRLDQSKITIVLTHGWNSSVEGSAEHPDWPLVLAQALATRGIDANIVAWDWKSVAEWRLNDVFGTAPGRISQHTPSQGLALGRALFANLTEGYDKQLHFIGHSLGTLVNAAAVNYLQGITFDSEPSEPWGNSLRFHLTLFDDAEIASQTDPSAIVRPGSYAHPLPRRFVWADNYFTLAGDRYEDDRVVNVHLWRGLGLLANINVPEGIVRAHGYPYDWYTRSVSQESSLGHRYSFERMGEQARFPRYNEDIVLVQNLTGEDLFLHSEDLSNWVSALGYHEIATTSEVLLGALNAGVGAIQIAGEGLYAAGEVTVTIAHGFVSAVGNVGSRVADASTRTVNAISVAIHLRPRPQTQPSRASALLALSTPSEIPFARMSVAIPVDATSLAFDFSLEGYGAEDFLTAGINGQNVFALETKFIPANEILTSGSIDVRQYAGQTIELFFGLLGGTSTDATATVQSIRFYTTTPPSLTVTADAAQNTATLQWPAWATHYSLESTTDLNSPDWQYVPDLPTFTDTTQTLTLPNNATTRYFRLRL